MKIIRNGFLYPFFDSLIKALCFCNIVELFKYIARFSVRVEHQRSGNDITKEDIISASNVAIDVYQFLKFGILFVFWICEYSFLTTEVIVYYLLMSNLFTYFYYHVWGSKYGQRNDRDALNRKFMNSILAITFYLLCYAYLYQYYYHEMISWPDGVIDFYNAIYLSISTAFTLTYGGFQPITQEIRMIFMSELINTFLFLTIILTNSIPNHTTTENDA